MVNEQLSTHFWLLELTATMHRTIDNRPSLGVIERLHDLANIMLEPILMRFGSIFVTSGYRCQTLNTVIGGAQDSAHTYGCAADLVPRLNTVTLDGMIRWIVNDSGLPYDQVIIEHATPGSWLHIGMLRPGHESAPRHEALEYKDGSYSRWVGMAV
jgi:hypothetical protein